MEQKQYRSFQYQIKYRKDLDVIDKNKVNQYIMTEHFAKKGYDNLYLSDDNKIVSVVSFEDYLSGIFIEGMNRNFILSLDKVTCREDIEHFFIDNPDVDRISVIEKGNLICEIDSMVEIPIQNGLAKNLMSLRYIDIFFEELQDYFHQYKTILLLAENAVLDYLRNKFEKVSFDNITEIEKAERDKLAEKYDIIIDFKYCSNLRRVLQYKPQNLISFSQIMMRFAIHRLVEYCGKKDVQVRFYKIQKYDSLNCLTEQEYKNSVSRVKTGKLIKEGQYFAEYKATSEEMNFIRNRMYHVSYRLDDGFCFVQDDCDEPGIKVQEDIRCTGNNFIEKSNSQHVCFYGPCTTFGFLMPDNMTIPALVEKMALDDGKNVVVENRAGIHGYNEINAIMSALNTPVKSGDILIFLDSLEDLDYSEYPNAIDAADWFNKEKDNKTTMFFDFPGHCSYKANKVLAKNIYSDIRNYIDNSSSTKEIRSNYSLCEFNRFLNMKETHASCFRFFMNYGSQLLLSENFEKIGAVTLPDNYDSEKCQSIVNKANEHCDALYVFKFNINLPDANFCRDFFEKFDVNNNADKVRLLQLDRFYYADRYLSTSANIERFVFIEKAFLISILRELKINIRFLTGDKSNVANRYIKQLCTEENILCIDI